MGNREAFSKVVCQIRDLYDDKGVRAYALCRKYALLARQTAQESQGTAQGQGQFWTNRTSDAVQGIRGYTALDGKVEGVTFNGGDHASLQGMLWGIAHTKEYGKYLELAKGRGVRPLLEPAVRALSAYFMDELREIYAG